MTKQVKLYEIGKLLMLRKFLMNIDAAAKNTPALAATGQAELDALKAAAKEKRPAVAAVSQTKMTTVTA